VTADQPKQNNLLMVIVAPITEDNFKKCDLGTLKPNRPDVVNNKLEILAGPIIRFWGLSDVEQSDQKVFNGIWRGSISYVTRDSGSDYTAFPQMIVSGQPVNPPFRYGQEQGISFWRFDVDIPTHPTESVPVSYQLGVEHRAYEFWIPGQLETMRTMFYSCNGFSLGVDTSQFPGCLWDDVLRKHNEKKPAGDQPNPFHVMLGGGDQLYCDSINLVLPENAVNSQDEVKEEAKMRALIDQYYLYQYTNWYGRGWWKGLHGDTEQRGWVETLGTIPTLNIWDDHDIIDGFGTYKNSTMSSPIFVLLGEYAYKYYLLFQQNVGLNNDPKLDDPCWICTGQKGPYIGYPARSIFARLGKSAAFLGLDCRTERRKNQVVSPSHYKAVFQRINQEFKAAPTLKHMYLMLGVPIAYPRMVWAENLMSSRLIEPVKWLSKKGIILKGFVNPFDGDVELLDDLNDHWTAKHHKRERNHFLHKLMDLQRDLSIRVTILGGDVHLSAVGVFKSLKHKAPEHDHTFMVCPVSSAIVNTPPPSALADFMNRRNHKHIFHGHVEERMVPIFANMPDGEAAGRNNTMMAKRNYCVLDPLPEVPQDVAAKPQYPKPAFADHEVEAHNPAINVVPDSIRMSLMVEKDNLSPDAETVQYSMYIPTLKSRP